MQTWKEFLDGQKGDKSRNETGSWLGAGMEQSDAKDRFRLDACSVL